MLERSLSVSSCLSFSCFSPSWTSSLPHSTCSLSGTPSSKSTTPRETTAAPSHNEEYCAMAIHHPLTGFEPNVLDNSHYLETSAMIFQDESGDTDTEPSYLCDVELDDETIAKVTSATSSTTSNSQRPLKFLSRSRPATRGPRTCMTRRSVTTPSAERSLRHCSPRSEKNQRAVDKLTTLMKKVCSQLSPFSHTQPRRDPYTNLIHLTNGNQVATSKTKESGFSFERQKEQIFAEI